MNILIGRYDDHLINALYFQDVSKTTEFGLDEESLTSRGDES